MSRQNRMDNIELVTIIRLCVQTTDDEAKHIL